MVTYSLYKYHKGRSFEFDEHLNSTIFLHLLRNHSDEDVYFICFSCKCLGHPEVISPWKQSDEEGQLNSHTYSNNFIYALRLLWLCCIREPCTRQPVGWLLQALLVSRHGQFLHCRAPIRRIPGSITLISHIPTKLVSMLRLFWYNINNWKGYGSTSILRDWIMG